MKKIQQKYRNIGLKLLTATMVFIVAVMPASACFYLIQFPEPTQLTFNEARDNYHSISADGSRIAFRSNVDGDNEIFVVNSDGSGLNQLTYNKREDGAPSISADGSKIAFQSEVNGDFEIFVINSDGSGLTQLTDNEVHDNQPSISADGSIIAFRSNVDGGHEIFVVNSDGTGLSQLTDDGAIKGSPYISADGRSIAFKSKLDGDYEIFVAELITLMICECSGSDCLTVFDCFLTQITHNEADDASPAISADGSRIAFVSNVDGDKEIFMADRSEPEVMFEQQWSLTQMTYNEVDDSHTSISADGSRIAYRSFVDDHYEVIIRMADYDFCSGIRFPEIAIEDVPRMSADGTKIAFKSNVDGDDEIFFFSFWRIPCEW